MKTLYLLRHAKSSWDDPDLDDFDRPLNERGEKDAPRIGKRLNTRKVLPDTLYSSPARRAITTAQVIADCIDYPTKNIRLRQELYHAGENMLLDFVRTLSPESQTVMIAGHNPGLTDFANALIKETIDNIPTAGIIGIEFDANSWKEIVKGRLIFFEYPKK